MDPKLFLKKLMHLLLAVLFLTTTIQAQNTTTSYSKSHPITDSRKIGFQSGGRQAGKKNIPGLQRPSNFIDSCKTTLYRLVLGGPGLSEIVNDVTVLQNDQVLLAGSVELTATNKDGLLSKL